MSIARRVLVGTFVLATCCIALAFLLPSYHLTSPPQPADIVNDVARLNRTLVRKVVHPKDEKEIRNAVLGAVSNGAKVTIAGKRHSMGGQTIHAGAVALDMLQFNKILSLDGPNKTFTAQSGAALRATHIEA
jgi:decaprenylphospho-beta-D-ribofuranose 2-oxidase